MNETDLEDALYDWATNALGTTIPVVWAHQNAPRPSLNANNNQATSYVMLHIMSDGRVGGMDYVGRVYENTETIDGVDTIVQSIPVTGNREFTLHCESYGSGSADFLRTLRSSLECPSIQQQLEDAGIVFVDQLFMGDISAVLETRYESRDQLDLLFRYAEATEDVNIGSIDTVNFTGKYKFGNQEIDKNKTVTIAE